MRKLFFSLCAIGFAVTALSVWIHTSPAPVHAGQVTSINPTEMTTNYKGSLPVEAFEAI